MKKHSDWSYRPYKPLFTDTGDIYICRLEPSETSIRIEWLDIGECCSVFYRIRNGNEFSLAGTTDKCFFDITCLKSNTDYEFFVSTESGKRSRIRLARTGKSVGKVVNYLHPDDEVYAFSGKYLCSPSLLRHDEGYILASMDVYAGMYPQNLTLIFRSDDNGESWYYQNELFPCFWGKMFMHKGELYMLAVSTEYGDLLIGKSSDGGKTFCEPTVLLRGGGGKNREPGVHKNPQPVVEFGGRIWNTLEWGSWGKKYHAVMVMSADTNANLLDPESWSFSEPVKYNPEWEGVPAGESAGNIEGSLCSVDGELYNIMRYSMDKLERKYGLVISYRVNTSDPEAPLEYAGCIEFPCNNSKFEIKYDALSRKYYSVATRITDGEKIKARNLLSLMVSDDCREWRTLTDLIDMRDCDHALVGFQYVDFEFEGDDIIFLCRTAINGAHSYHDSNYSTFHRIKNFRSL